MDRMSRRDWLRLCATAAAAPAALARAACERSAMPGGDGRLRVVFLDDRARPQGTRVDELRQRLGAQGLGEDRLRLDPVLLTPSDREDVRCAIEAGLAARPLAFCTASAPLAQSALALAGGVPLVFAVYGDPVAHGLIDAPGPRRANATGFTFETPIAPDLKCFEVLAEAFPRVRRVVVVADEVWSNQAGRAKQLQRVHSQLGLEVALASVPRNPAMELARLAAGGTTAAYLPGGDLLLQGTAELFSMLQRERMPHLCADERSLRHGAMLTYAPRRLAHWDAVAAILRAIAGGTPARDIALQWPTEHLLSVSLAPWQRMGLAPPAKLLRRAHAVI